MEERFDLIIVGAGPAGISAAIVAAKDEPTEPLEPTRYPSSFDFHTSFCAIIYMTEYPLDIIELSSLSSLSVTI